MLAAFGFTAARRSGFTTSKAKRGGDDDDGFENTNEGTRDRGQYSNIVRVIQDGNRPNMFVLVTRRVEATIPPGSAVAGWLACACSHELPVGAFNLG